MAGPREHPGTALAWTAWGSRALPGAAERARRLPGRRGGAARRPARAWPRGWPTVAADELGIVLEEAAARTGLVRPTALAYAPARPVRVAVRRARRAGRDRRRWAAPSRWRAGRPGWREAAGRAVAALGWNVTRDGVVFVQAAADRDVEELVRRTAEASLAVRDAILALEDF